jgi:hypothetical protein
VHGGISRFYIGDSDAMRFCTLLRSLSVGCGHRNPAREDQEVESSHARVGAVDRMAREPERTLGGCLRGDFSP